MDFHALPFTKILTCLTAATVVGCAGLAGEVRDGRYVSPAGNFSLSLQGGLFEPPNIRDSYDESLGWGTIEADYDTGSIDAVSYLVVPPEMIEEVRSAEAGRYRDLLLSEFTDEFLPNVYPNANVQAGPTFVPSDNGEMLFAILRVPEGSHVFSPRKNRFEDGIRGVLIFFAGNCGYHLQKEAVDGLNLDPSDEEVKQRTLALYERMEFKK